MLRNGRARARSLAIRAAAVASRVASRAASPARVAAASSAAGDAPTSGGQSDGHGGGVGGGAVGGAMSEFLASAKARAGTSRDDRWSRINSTMRTLGRVSDNHTTKLTPYYDTGEAYRDMWRCVDAAKTSVVWHTYICKDDNVGKITLAKLVAAKKRGVEVELLYDSGGNITGRGRLMAELKAAGGNVITYRPFHTHLWRYMKHAFDWRQSPALRNHRKILVVDNEVAFIGGLNIGDDYAETTVGGNGRFRDTMCAIRGPAVQHVVEVCRDTVENQEGSELHPSRAVRWRQWARRVAPVRMRASLTMHRQMRKARTHLLRQLERAERIRTEGGAPAAAARASARAKRAATRLAQRVARNGAKSVSGKTRRERVADRIEAIRAEVHHAHSGRELARTAMSSVTDRARHVVSDLLKRVHRHGGRQRAARAAGHDSDTVTQAVALRSRFEPAVIPPELLATPESADGCPVLDEQANAPTAAESDSTRRTRIETEPLSTIIDKSRATTVESAQVLMCNPHTRDWSLQRALWIATREAHRRVWVTTPYFLPHGQLFRAVLAAANSGVDVRIMAGSSNTTDPWFMWYTSQYVRHKLLAAGVKVYEFDGGKIMHAKTVVVDRRWACVGSYNWDILSNKLLEASVAAYDRDFARTLEEHFLQDMAMSRRITEDDYVARPWYTRLACCLFYHGVWLTEMATFRGYRDRDLHSPMGAKVDP